MWAELAPRRKTVAVRPAPPLWTTSTPGTARRSSNVEVLPAAAIVAASTTVTELPTWSAGVAVRFAETTTCSVRSVGRIAAASGEAELCGAACGAASVGAAASRAENARTTTCGRRAVRRPEGMAGLLSPPRGQEKKRTAWPGQVSWLTFILLAAPSRLPAVAGAERSAPWRLSSRSQSRGGGRFALPSLGPGICGVHGRNPANGRILRSSRDAAIDRGRERRPGAAPPAKLFLPNP